MECGPWIYIFTRTPGNSHSNDLWFEKHYSKWSTFCIFFCSAQLSVIMLTFLAWGWRRIFFKERWRAETDKQSFISVRLKGSNDKCLAHETSYCEWSWLHKCHALRYKLILEGQERVKEQEALKVLVGCSTWKWGRTEREAWKLRKLSKAL